MLGWAIVDRGLVVVGKLDLRGRVDIVVPREDWVSGKMILETNRGHYFCKTFHGRWGRCYRHGIVV